MTQDQINKIIENAKEVVLKAKDNASKSNIPTAIKDSLLNSTSQIQGILNIFLSNSGVLTQDQYDRLDEQMRIAKKNMLEAETLEATKRFAIYATFVVVLFGVVYFISKKD